MFQNKLVRTMIIIIAVLSLAGVVTLYAYFHIFNKDSNMEPSIDEIVEFSLEFPEITTNLLDGGFVRVSFTFQTDSKKAKAELSKRDFQVKNVVIHILSSMKRSDLQSGEGKLKLENLVQMKINELLQEGKISKVYTTSFVIQ